jgi:hypothetical protein
MDKPAPVLLRRALVPLLLGIFTAPVALADLTGTLHVKRDAAELVLEMQAEEEAFTGGTVSDDAEARLDALQGVTEALYDVSAMFRPTLNANCRLLEIRIGGGSLEAAGLAGRHAPDEARSEQLRAHGRPLAAEAQDEEAGQGASSEQDATPPDATDESAAVPDDDGMIRARYAFECARPLALRDLMVPAFASFPELRRLDVTLEDERGAREQTLAASSPLLMLR